MTEPDPAARAVAAAQLHDAACAARQVAAGRETALAPSPLPEGTTAPGLGHAQPVLGHQPSHPAHTLTARELRAYQRDLEQALNGLPAHAPVRELLQRNLADVRAEQDARAQPASPPGADPDQ